LFNVAFALGLAAFSQWAGAGARQIASKVTGKVGGWASETTVGAAVIGVFTGAPEVGFLALGMSVGRTVARAVGRAFKFITGEGEGMMSRMSGSFYEEVVKETVIQHVLLNHIFGNSAASEFIVEFMDLGRSGYNASRVTSAATGTQQFVRRVDAAGGISQVATDLGLDQNEKRLLTNAYNSAVQGQVEWATTFMNDLTSTLSEKTAGKISSMKTDTGNKALDSLVGYLGTAKKMQEYSDKSQFSSLGIADGYEGLGVEGVRDLGNFIASNPFVSINLNKYEGAETVIVASMIAGGAKIDATNKTVKKLFGLGVIDYKALTGVSGTSVIKMINSMDASARTQLARDLAGNTANMPAAKLASTIGNLMAVQALESGDSRMLRNLGVSSGVMDALDAMAPEARTEALNDIKSRAPNMDIGSFNDQVSLIVVGHTMIRDKANLEKVLTSLTGASSKQVQKITSKVNEVSNMTGESVDATMNNIGAVLLSQAGMYTASELSNRIMNIGIGMALISGKEATAEESSTAENILRSIMPANTEAEKAKLDVMIEAFNADRGLRMELGMSLMNSPVAEGHADIGKGEIAKAMERYAITCCKDIGTQKKLIEAILPKQAEKLNTMIDIMNSSSRGRGNYRDAMSKFSGDFYAFSTSSDKQFAGSMENMLLNSDNADLARTTSFFSFKNVIRDYIQNRTRVLSPDYVLNSQLAEAVKVMATQDQAATAAGQIMSGEDVRAEISRVRSDKDSAVDLKVGNNTYTVHIDGALENAGISRSEVLELVKESCNERNIPLESLAGITITMVSDAASPMASHMQMVGNGIQDTLITVNIARITTIATNVASSLNLSEGSTKALVNNFIKMGLSHEMRHEATGAQHLGNSQAQELALTMEDVSMLGRMAAEAGITGENITRMYSAMANELGAGSMLGEIASMVASNEGVARALRDGSISLSIDNGKLTVNVSEGVAHQTISALVNIISEVSQRRGIQEVSVNINAKTADRTVQNATEFMSVFSQVKESIGKTNIDYSFSIQNTDGTSIRVNIMNNVMVSMDLSFKSVFSVTVNADAEGNLNLNELDSFAGEMNGVVANMAQMDSMDSFNSAVTQIISRASQSSEINLSSVRADVSVAGRNVQLQANIENNVVENVDITFSDLLAKGRALTVTAQVLEGAISADKIERFVKNAGKFI